MKNKNQNRLGRAKKIITLTAASTQIANIFAPFVMHAAPRAPLAAPALMSTVTEVTYSPGLIYSLSSSSSLELTQYSPIYSGIPVDSNLTLSFNDTFELGDGIIVIRRNNDDYPEQFFNITSGVIHGAAITFSGNSVVIDPDFDLNENTSYYVYISSGAFVSSNGTAFSGVSPYSWTFMTEDTTPPVLISTIPGSGIISQYDNFYLTFNESVQLGYGQIQIIKQGEVTPEYVISISGSEVSNANYFFSTDDHQVEFSPYFILEEDTSYYVNITSGAFTDWSSNAYAGLLDPTSWQFTTTHEDPYVRYMEQNLEMNLRNDTDLTFHLNKPMLFADGLITIKNAKNNSVFQQFVISSGNIYGATATFSSSGYSFTLNPDVDFEDFTTYYVNFSSGAFTDLNGRPSFGLFHSDMSFTTGDFTPPEVVETFPMNSSGLSSIYGYYDITFNEDVKFGYGEIQFFKQGDNLPVGTITISGNNMYNGDYYSYSKSYYTFYPNFSFEDGTSYYINITSGAFVDLHGNNYRGINDTTSWNFTTIMENPFIEYFSLRGLSELQPNVNLTFTFNELVQLSNGAISIMRADNQSVARQFLVSSGVIQGATATFSGTSLTIDPYLNLDSSTDYYLNISSGTFVDLKGNLFSGLTHSRWGFSTGDFAPPSIVNTYPNGNEVSIYDKISLDFNEKIKLGHGNIQLFEKGTNALLHTITVDGDNVSNARFFSYNGKRADFYLEFLLEQDTQYYITVDPNVFLDLDNNPFDGILDSDIWSFKTADVRPFLTNNEPNNLSGLPIDTNLTFYFNETVQLNNGAISLIRQQDGSVAQEFVISSGHINGAAVSFSGRTMTLNPDFDLENATSYFVKISSGSFIDTTGNLFSGTDFSSWYFSIGDFESPVIVSGSPMSDNTYLDEPISFNFNENIKLGYGEIQIFKQGAVTPDHIITISGNHVSNAYFYRANAAKENTAYFLPYFTLDQDSSYYIHVTSGTFVDMSNNKFTGLLDSTTWNFTTIDVSPYLLRYYPSDLSGLPADTNLFFYFSEPTQLANGEITLRREQDGTIAREFTISSGHINGATIFYSGNTMILDPDFDLEELTSYYVQISSGSFVDLKNNPFSGLYHSSWSFSVGDFSPPVMLDASPISGAAALKGPYSFIFNEDIELGYGEIQFFKQGEVTPVHTISISGDTVSNAVFYRSSGNTAYFHPHFVLDQSTDYYVHVTSGTFVDLYNNQFAGLLDSTTWSFTTVDYEPYLAEISVSYESNLPVDTNITLSFSEDIRLAHGIISLINKQNNNVAREFIISSGLISNAAFSLSGNILVLDPDADLNDSTEYFISITSGAFVDLNGNPSRMFYDTNMSFKTGDFTAPTIVSVSPVSDNTYLDEAISFNFNETIKLGYGEIQIFKQGAVTPDHIITLSGNHVSNAYFYRANAAEENTAYFLPYFTLDQDSSYYVHVTSGAFVDKSNNKFTGLLDSTTWNFTTINVSPYLLNYYPNAISGLPIDTNLTFYFSEYVNLANGNVSIVRAADDSVAQQFTISSGQIQGADISFSGNVMTLDPNLDLEQDMTYYVQISSGAFVDIKGKPFSGFYHLDWSFTIGDFTPPALVSTSPVSGNVSNYEPLSLAFNEEVKLGYGEIQIFKQGEATPAHTISIANNKVNNAYYEQVSGRFFSFNPFFHLEQDTNYYIHITSGTFVDLSNNLFAGLLDSTSWSFTTIDEKPSLWYYSPRQESGIPIDTNLSFYFSEPIKLANGSISLIREKDDSVAQEFVISSGHINGAAVTFSGTVMTLDPDTNLDSSTAYYVTITSGAFSDMKGQLFSGFPASHWSFTTGDFTPPVVVYTSPVSNEASYYGQYSVTFNEGVELGQGEIQIFKQGESAPVQVISIANNQVSNAYSEQVSGGYFNFYPEFELDQDTSYYVHITSGAFVDLSSNPFMGLLDSTTWSFTTYNQAPYLTSYSPSNLSGLPVDTNLTFYFSEYFDLANGNVSIVRAADDSVAQQFAISSGQIQGAAISFSGSTMTLDPNLNLEPSTSYYVQISSGAFVDIKGKPFSGLHHSYWNFTTAAQTNNGGNNGGNTGGSQPSQPSPTTTPSNPVVVPSEAAPVIPNSAQANVVAAPFKTGQEKSVTLPASQTGSSALVYYYDEKYKQWIALPTQHDGSTLYADMPAESWVAVMDNQTIYQPVDTESNWANKDILKLMSLNIVQGYEDQTFKPNQATNRYEMAVMMAKVLGLPLASTDVTALNTLPDSGSIPEWAKPAVAALLQNNIMLGSAQGFQGSESITRAQLAAMLGRILPAAQNNTASSFKDQTSIPAWASDGIQKAIELGIFQGYPDGSFQPDKTLTRAEMAAVITRLMDYLIQQPNQ